MIRIEVLEDYDTRPTEFDCYGYEDIAAWGNDEWRYVGVRVMGTVKNIEYDLTVTSNAIWGVEFGAYFENNDAHIRELAQEQWEAVPAELRAQFPELSATTPVDELGQTV